MHIFFASVRTQYGLGEELTASYGDGYLRTYCTHGSVCLPNTARVPENVYLQEHLALASWPMKVAAWWNPEMQPINRPALRRVTCGGSSKPRVDLVPDHASIVLTRRILLELPSAPMTTASMMKHGDGNHGVDGKSRIEMACKSKSTKRRRVARTAPSAHGLSSITPEKRCSPPRSPLLPPCRAASDPGVRPLCPLKLPPMLYRQITTGSPQSVALRAKLMHVRRFHERSLLRMDGA